MSSGTTITITGTTDTTTSEVPTITTTITTITNPIPTITSTIPTTIFSTSSFTSFITTTVTSVPSSSTTFSSSSTSSSTSTFSQTTATTTISSILISSVTVGTSSTTPTSTSGASENNSGSSPVLVTTISVVVGAILLALLAAWIIHTLVKSRREKKEKERLAMDEDLDGMFQTPIMVNNVSNGRNSMYEQNEVFWDQKTEDNGASVISIESQEYPSQSPEIDSQLNSRAQDSEDHGIPASRLQSQSDFTAVEGAAITGASMAGAESVRQGTMGSNSTSPLIQNGKGRNFVRVISDYAAVRPDELNMRQGQILMLEQTFQDGWAFGKNITTEERGMFPFNFVAPVDSSIFQQSMP